MKIIRYLPQTGFEPPDLDPFGSGTWKLPASAIASFISANLPDINKLKK
jgi:hypothetical protein